MYKISKALNIHRCSTVTQWLALRSWVWTWRDWLRVLLCGVWIFSPRLGFLRVQACWSNPLETLNYSICLHSLCVSSATKRRLVLGVPCLFSNAVRTEPETPIRIRRHREWMDAWLIIKMQRVKQNCNYGLSATILPNQVAGKNKICEDAKYLFHLQSLCNHKCQNHSFALDTQFTRLKK